ncbi:MAG: hypothetical protein WBM23_08340 [Desulfomonilia bacterium]
MPFINTAVTVSLVCWDTVNNVGKTGDASNITLRGVRDGTLFTPSEPSITQVDSTNLPGVYKASLTASENNGTLLTLGGKSSSTGCVIIPVSWSNELTGDAFARLGAPAGASVSADIAAVKAKTDNLPASPAAVGSAMTLTSAYDAAKSAASQASVTTIEGIVDDILVDTGTTLPATLTALPAAIWNHLLSAMSTVGSVGLRLAQWLTIIPDDATAYGATDLSICNNALVQLGNEPLLNLTDTTKKAVRLCVQFYDQTVEEVLRAYNWNCATVRDTLTVDETAPAWGYNYRYALPADCLRVIGFSSDSVKWTVENGYILADSDGGEISYIKLITAADMDALLRSAVSARLAAYLAFPLTNSATVAKAMFDLYKEKLADAHTMDAFENGTGEHLASDTWINARGQ